MKKILQTAIRLSVYHIARQTATHIEKQMNSKDRKEEELKREMLIASSIHTLLGIIYNH